MFLTSAFRSAILPHVMRSCVLVLLVLAIAVPPAEATDEAKAKVRDPRAESLAYFADFKEKSPIHYYLSTGRYDEAIPMFRSIEDIDAINQVTKKTALTAAAHGRSSDAYDAVRSLILEHGADVSKPDESGLTALHFAVAAGNLPVVALLLKYGANIHAAPPKDRNCTMNCKKGNRTALYMAHQYGDSRVRDFLVSMGAQALDPDIVKELGFRAKRLELAEKHRSSPPRGLDEAGLEDWYRKKYTASFNDLQELLRSEGRFEDANRLPDELEPLIQALMETSRTPGMSLSEWNRLVRKNMVKHMIQNE